MDNAHSHPTTYPSRDGQFSLPSTRRHSRPHSTSLSPPATAQVSTPTPSSRQHRLLQNRNTHFPAKKLSVSGISARFSQLIHANNDLESRRTQSPKQENRPLNNTSLRSVKRFDLSNSSLSILDEVTNKSIGRGKTRRKPIPGFQDSPRRPLLDQSPVDSPSIYQDASSEISSPVTFEHIRDSINNMRLREVSGNERKSSPLASSPFMGSPQTRRRTTSARNKQRFDSEEYIEHIENELQYVKEAMHSSNTSRAWKEKLNAAKQENERLRKELTEARLTFEAEVQSTVERMTQTEVDLRRKIMSLEMQLEEKTMAMQERQLHYEDRRDPGALDTLKTTIDKLEQEKINLEEVNRSINKRNEVLTQLLAISPSKLGIETASPARPKNPRPRSMMLVRMPTSPGFGPVSRGLASPALSATCCFSPSSLASEYAMPLGEIVVDPTKQDGKGSALDCGGRQSQSIRSPKGTSSRRSTMQSQVSLSSSGWGFPLLTSPTGESKPQRQQSRRKPRRFESGSTSLKPLLLSTLAGDSGSPVSPSRVPLPPSPEKRDISMDSVDPTTAFVSLSEEYAVARSESDTYPLEWQFSKHTSHLTPDDEERLQSLQCHSAQDESAILDEDIRLDADGLTSQSRLAQLDDSVEIQSSDGDTTAFIPARSRPISDTIVDGVVYPSYEVDEPGRSSTEPFPMDCVDLTRLSELHLPSPQFDSYSQRNAGESPAEVPAPLFSPFVDRYTPSRRSDQFSYFDHQGRENLYGSGRSRKRKKSWSSLSCSSSPFIHKVEESSLLVSPSPSPRLFLVPTSQISRAASPQSVIPSTQQTKSLSRRSTHSPLQVLQRHGLGARPLASVTIQTIYGTISRYTTYIRELRQDPLAMSRRLIVKAWMTNWKIVGKLSWWVLGLFLGNQRRNNYCSQWDPSKCDGSAIAQEVFAAEEQSSAGVCADTQEHMTTRPSSHQNLQDNGEAPQSSAQPTKRKGKPDKKGWGESLYLWGKFSVVIMLTVGGAIVKGPAEMLKDLEDPKQHRRTSRRHTTSNAEGGGAAARKREVRVADHDIEVTKASGFARAGYNEELHSRKHHKKRRPSVSSLCNVPRHQTTHENDLTAEHMDKHEWHQPNYHPMDSAPPRASFQSHHDPDDTLRPTARHRVPDLQDLFSTDQFHPYTHDSAVSTKTTARPLGQREYDPESPALALPPDRTSFET